MTEMEAKSIIRKSVIKTKLGLLLTSLLSLSMGGYLVGNIFMGWEPMDLIFDILSGLVGLIFIVTGLLCFYMAIRPDPLLRLIFKNPEEIAWIYTQNILLYGHNTQNVNLYIYSNKKSRHFLVSTKRNVDALVDILKTRAPHAHFGYDKEFEEKFRTRSN